MSTFFCLIIVYCSIPSLKSGIWWYELWQKDREINNDQGLVHPGVFISESPSSIIEAISSAFWCLTVAWISHECGIIYQYTEDVTHELSQDLKSFFKFRLSLYNQWMTLSRIKQKNIWDDQLDLNSDQIYDETKELLLIFKYVVGWLMISKDVQWRRQWHPLLYFCLENPMDEGAWWAAVHGVARVGHDWVTSLSLSCIGEGNGNPLQCSCLESPRDGEAWWAALYGVAQSQTRLKRLSSSSNSSKDVHVLGFGTCQYVTYMTKGTLQIRLS